MRGCHVRVGVGAKASIDTEALQAWAGGASAAFDAHCHLGFASDALALARGLKAAGVQALSNTVTPRGYMMDSLRLRGAGGVFVGLGLHPWQVSGDDEVALLEFEALAADAPFIGEVGLDFSARWVATRGAQLTAFERICAVCAQLPAGRILSIHAVGAVDEVLAALCAHGLAEQHVCVLHSFGGSHQQLLKAVDAGCWFSVGERFLQRKSAASYLHSIPSSRLLLETDLPATAGEECSAQTLIGSLERSHQRVAELVR